jgi:hypothetical protein
MRFMCYVKINCAIIYLLAFFFNIIFLYEGHFLYMNINTYEFSLEKNVSKKKEWNFNHKRKKERRKHFQKEKERETGFKKRKRKKGGRREII